MDALNIKRHFKAGAGATAGFVTLAAIGKAIANSYQASSLSQEMTFGIIGWLVVFVFVARESYRIHLRNTRDGSQAGGNDGSA